MENTQAVMIDLVKGSSSEYIIRDNLGITIGRVFTLDFSKINKYTMLRMKFYKSGDRSYKLLRESLEVLTKSLFQNMSLNKINILVDDDINMDAFIDSGFKFEGIISNSIKNKSKYKNEILFGIDFNEFKNITINKGLHINGKNINIKLLTPSDTNDLLKYYIKNREYLSKFEPKREEEFYTFNVQKKNLIEDYKDFLNGKSLNFGIYKNSKLIGKIQMSNVVTGIFKSAFVGYSIDEDEQGKGYMKEALGLVVNYAFEEMNLHRLEASTLVDNFRSQAVLESCGFNKLGLNKSYLFINGKWRDHITFYKINSKM
ncbi:GNAT family N-acetyltransferase [Clostridium sp. cel8]|jgi:[ribosomal protein S5]-alanine N-acetyltransferase|uniref:GNAT family N-acetyltransferase n=1 Tax=unclassified Clostridium TaxID=2614128 RepID=UPI0015F3BBE2|nr:GNAT family protein [Clostridium sp. cel8]MBA5851797.1 GNAT family N-acetyltransferase [Clostridium sp. cel8]